MFNRFSNIQISSKEFKLQNNNDFKNKLHKEIITRARAGFEIRLQEYLPFCALAYIKRTRGALERAQKGLFLLLIN